MTPLLELPPEVLAVVPLAVAAGADLYLTLLLLGLAPHTGWWVALPGALGDLDSAPILVIVGGFYVLELLAERWFSSALVWNAFHAIIRPVAGALLALLLLDGLALEVSLLLAAVAGFVASGAHAVRTGGGVLLRLDAADHPDRALVAAFEDVAVLGVVVLTLDRPAWALATVGVVILAAAPLAGSQVRAFAFAVRSAWSRAWTTLDQPGWEDPEAFPDWVGEALEGDVMAPGGGLRGAPAGGRRIPGARPFVTGWVVVRGDTPLFLHRTVGGTQAVDLGRLRVTGVSESAFFRRVSLHGTGPVHLYLKASGPGAESLRAEFSFGP